MLHLSTNNWPQFLHGPYPNAIPQSCCTKISPEQRNLVTHHHGGAVYFLVVKSISLAGLYPPSAAFSQVQPSRIGVSHIIFKVSAYALGAGRHILAGREPQAHVEPLGVTFSVAALLHVHSPAGRARHEHRGPWTLFSVVDLAQLQLRADCLPQEQVACWALNFVSTGVPLHLFL